MSLEDFETGSRLAALRVMHITGKDPSMNIDRDTFGEDGLMTVEEFDTSQRVARLPVWARDELTRTRRRLAEHRLRWRLHVDHMQRQAGARPDTFVGHHYDEETYPLPRGQSVRFELDDDRLIVGVIRPGVAAELDIRHEGMGNGQLALVPQHSNVVRVRLIRR